MEWDGVSKVMTQSELVKPHINWPERGKEFANDIKEKNTWLPHRVTSDDTVQRQATEQLFYQKKNERMVRWRITIWVEEVIIRASSSVNTINNNSSLLPSECRSPEEGVGGLGENLVKPRCKIESTAVTIAPNIIKIPCVTPESRQTKV